MSAPARTARRAWTTLKRAARAFGEHGMTDWGAALTFYAILSVFPTLIVLVALLGLLGEYPRTVEALMEMLGEIAPASTVEVLRGTVAGVVREKGGAGALLGVGLLAALWSASGYLSAFMRAANAAHGVEGRPMWKRRLLQLGMTVALVAGIALMAIGFVFTGGLAHAAGDAIGAGDTAVRVWERAKWPAMALLAAAVIALLYSVAPNVRRRRLRLLTPGGTLALVAFAAVSTGFAHYVRNFGSYNETYGALGGIVVFLLWLYLANLALLLGIEVDAERERSQE